MRCDKKNRPQCHMLIKPITESSIIPAVSVRKIRFPSDMTFAPELAASSTSA